MLDKLPPPALDLIVAQVAPRFLEPSQATGVCSLKEFDKKAWAAFRSTARKYLEVSRSFSASQLKKFRRHPADREIAKLISRGDQQYGIVRLSDVVVRWPRGCIFSPEHFEKLRNCQTALQKDDPPYSFLDHYGVLDVVKSNFRNVNPNTEGPLLRLPATCPTPSRTAKMIATFREGGVFLEDTVDSECSTYFFGNPFVSMVTQTEWSGFFFLSPAFALL